jgi:hypothetical protein
MRDDMRLALTAALGLALVGGAGCIAKNGGEMQTRGTADTSTTAPATRPTNTNVSVGATAGGNAAAQSGTAPNTAGPDSTTGTPPSSYDTTKKKHR